MVFYWRCMPDIIFLRSITSSYNFWYESRECLSDIVDNITFHAGFLEGWSGSVSNPCLWDVLQSYVWSSRCCLSERDGRAYSYNPAAFWICTFFIGTHFKGVFSCAALWIHYKEAFINLLKTEMLGFFRMDPEQELSVYFEFGFVCE